MIRALIMTCAIEAAVTLLIVWIQRLPVHGRFFRRHTSARLMLYYNLLCNMLTNPLLNLSLYFAMSHGIGDMQPGTMILIGELCVVAAEYGLYRVLTGEGRGFCLFLSIVTNLVSYLSGKLFLQ